MTDITLRMNEEDIFPLLISAFRYALGRRSYMPSLISSIILANKDKLVGWQRHQFVDEVVDYKNMYGDLGDECDEKTWMRFCEEMWNE